MNHGYDESKPVSELDIEDMKAEARFRGGECLPEMMVKGDMMTPLKWRCAFGHEFTAAPNTILLLGHWRLDCLNDRWNYTEQAVKNPFFNQMRVPLHSADEDPVDVKMEADARDVEKLFKNII